MIKIDDSTDFALLTSAGQIRYQFSLSGTYSFYFTFGCSQIYIYRYRKNFDVYSRFFIPDDLNVLAISRERGFKIFSSRNLHDSAVVWLHCVHCFIQSLFDSAFNFSNLAHKRLDNLFVDQIELDLKNL